MQTLAATYYSILDDVSRKPCARIYCKKAGTSIPFVGKQIEASTENETNPKSIYHSSGRVVIVYSKVVSTFTQIHFRRTNVARTLWEDEVVLTTGGTNKSYPDLVEIVGGDIGIVYILGGIIYQMTVSIAGTIVSAAASTTYSGNTPSLEYVTATTKYWLVYEASGGLKYRTADVFGTWSAENSFVTGLANNHSFPVLYKDSSAKLWLVFQRVSDAAASPVVENVYYMTSTDNGTSWSASTAITSFVAGEGSAKHPSIVDTGGTYRYYSYFFEQLVQNYEYNNSAGTYNKFFVKDETNNRLLFITGFNSTNFRLVIYNFDTATYDYFLLSDHYLTSGDIRDLSYDEVNQKIVIATSADGIIVYDEGITTWSNYTTLTTPAILGDLVQNAKIIDNKIYYTSSPSNLFSFGVLDLGASTHTALTGTLNLSAEGGVSNVQIFISNNYIVYFLRPTNAPNVNYPYVRVYDITSLALLHTTNIGNGSQYTLNHFAITRDKKAKVGYDTVNNVLYTLAQDTVETHDYGIALYYINDVASTFVEYWTNAIGNGYGLLPNPDVAGDVGIGIIDLTFNSTSSRLYTMQHTTTISTGVKRELYITAFNTVTKTYINYFSQTNADDYTLPNPPLDAFIKKVLLANYYNGTVSYYPRSNDSGNLYFQSYDAGTEYRWHLLSTEGDLGGMYYRRTSDDITWSGASILTTEPIDDYLHLLYTNTMMVFWQRAVDGVTLLRYDIDLSAEINITQYVTMFEIQKTADESANTATVEVADPDGLFDQLNYNSLWSTYFEEDNIIRIEKGYSSYYYPAFYGYISGGRSNRNRGDASKYVINLIDRAKNFFKNKITTVLYEDKTIEYIATDIATTYMGFAVGEYEIPVITRVIHTVQFIEEYPMDILKKLFQSEFYFPYIDEENKLKARIINKDAVVDFTYFKDGTDVVGANKAPAFNIVSMDYEWNDEAITNRVKVIGETEATSETNFDEEFMGSIQGTAGWFSNKNTFDFYFSGDKGLYCINPRLNVVDSVGNKFFGGGEGVAAPGAGKQNYCTITQNVSNTVNMLIGLSALAAALTMLYGFFVGTGSGTCWVFNTMAPVLSMVVIFLGQISSYYYEIYAEPVGDAIPDTIEAVAEDTALITKNGTEIELVIDNPFLSTYAKCYEIAEYELEKAKWFVKQPQIPIIANQAHQCGDIISIYNKLTNNTYKVYIRGITQRFTRGQQDVDLIDAALIS